MAKRQDGIFSRCPYMARYASQHGPRRPVDGDQIVLYYNTSFVAQGAGGKHPGDRMAVRRKGIFRQAAWRRFALAIALIFLGSQIHALAHAAEYGDDFHSHKGVPCAIQLLFEAGKTLDTPVPPVVLSIAYFAGTVLYSPANEALPRESRRPHHYIRGPPLFLF